MKLLADLHISPDTVKFLRGLGYDVVRVNEVLPANAPDHLIISTAVVEGRAVLTQDLGFGAEIVLSRQGSPSLISLRLTSSRIEHVNSVLERVLPLIEKDLQVGSIVAVEDNRIRARRIPLK